MAFADPATGRVIVSSGRAPTPGKVTLAGTCKAGDVLGYSTGWKRASGLAATKIQGRLVALQDGVSTDEIEVSPDAVVSGYTGGTPGNPVYSAYSTLLGQVTDTISVTPTDSDKIVGYLISATTIQFCCMARPDHVVAG